ncbi:MAG: protein kinase [Planctomycetota bacterium]|nr:protein kinase [Planctomycetota bacterium]
MTVSIQCPSCGKAYHVKDESLGARAHCKSCGASFTLAMAMDDTSKSKVEEPAIDKAPPKPTADRAGHTKSAVGKAQAQPADQEQMPKKLGQYLVQRKLGAGAMGVVYLARDPILDRQVAIKVLPAALSNDQDRLKRFLREAKSAARLHHTNVAAVHQAGAEGRLAYIAMEYVEGISLDKAVSAKKPMAWREATRVVRDAAAGLGAAHTIGLVHRDIKPGNLIRTKDGVTKVVDFGLARGLQTDTQLTQQGMLLGTPAYMAPEQWMGGQVDGRSDLYALTCTYYFLLTGHLPFDAPSLPALGYQHRYEPFPDPRQKIPNLPDGICRILARGSAKEAEERFQSAEELVSELDVLLACPTDSLTFGSPWEQLGAPAGSALSPPPDPLADGLAALQTPSLPMAKPTPSRATRLKWDVPLSVWIATGGAAALLLLLGVMITFSTKYGTVRIALQGAAAKDVTITLDGETITINGLDEPLKVTVGEHNLIARSGNLETVTRSFQVKKNETTAVEVTFEPKLAAATTRPAAYRVSIDPPQAMLTASGEGVSVAGQGAERTVKVAEPNGRAKTTLIATLDGYQTLRRELQPTSGEVGHLILQLEPIPEKPSAGVSGTVAPPTADSSVPDTIVSSMDSKPAESQGPEAASEDDTRVETSPAASSVRLEGPLATGPPTKVTGLVNTSGNPVGVQSAVYDSKTKGYLTWFADRNHNNRNHAISCMSSRDGLQWENRREVDLQGISYADGYDEITSPLVEAVSSRYRMWAREYNRGHAWNGWIVTFESSDGYRWNAYRPVLQTVANDWERFVLDPMAILRTQNQSMLYYAANIEKSCRIGLATSGNGLSFTNRTRVFDLNLWGCDVVATQGSPALVMFYCPERDTVYATSEDGLKWSEPKVFLKDANGVRCFLDAKTENRYIYYWKDEILWRGQLGGDLFNPSRGGQKETRSGTAKVKTGESLGGEWAYLVKRPVPGITRASLATTIQRDAVPLTPKQLKAVEAKDGDCLGEGFYHIFKLPNKGITQVEWTGYGSGNGQILVHYWDGSQMVRKDIRGASQLATHRIPVSVPASEEFVYLMVNCTSGSVFTDAITHDGG